jgi:hypothetical protein
MTNEHLKGISHVVHISTNIGEGCEHCTFQIGTDKFAESINHYIAQHDYKLLHAGTETSEGVDGKLWYHSVALVGK